MQTILFREEGSASQPGNGGTTSGVSCNCAALVCIYIWGAASALGSVHLLLTIKQLGKRNFSVGRGSRSGDLECSAGAGSPGTPCW